MMRSFENRADTHVWDEPFFAPWLMATDKDHPGREETLTRHESDPRKVARQVLKKPPERKPYYFQKHMPHHMEEHFPVGWTRGCSHFFLIRKPERVIASYIKGRAKFDFDDIGFGPLVKFYDFLKFEGHDIAIVDCDDILENPELMLRALCRELMIPFDEAMLSWPAGPRPTDGAWAPWWYKSVEASTGFSPPNKTIPKLPKKYHDILEQSRPLYEKLHKIRLRPA